MYDFVMSVNVMRRHLSGSQRAYFAVQIKQEFQAAHSGNLNALSQLRHNAATANSKNGVSGQEGDKALLELSVAASDDDAAQMPDAPTDADLLERLLALNLARAGAGVGDAALTP